MMRQRLFLSLSLSLFLLAACRAPDRAAAPPSPAGSATPTPEATPEPAWQLVWQDEFDGEAIDATKWSLAVNERIYNGELQNYTDRPENAFLEGGYLVIQAVKPEGGYMGRAYTSAKISTLAKADWLYGRFEIRARLPQGQGLWPAIWLLPSQARYGGWPAGGEMDIMEMLGHEPALVQGTIHYSGADGHAFSSETYRLPQGDFASEFHVFAFEWEETEMRWYVDDALYFTATSWATPGRPYPAPFDQAFYLIMNLAVGGYWPGSPDETTVFPQRMEVDYVRVYQEAAGAEAPG